LGWGRLLGTVSFPIAGFRGRRQFVFFTPFIPPFFGASSPPPQPPDCSRLRLLILHLQPVSPGVCGGQGHLPTAFAVDFKGHVVIASCLKHPLLRVREENFRPGSQASQCWEGLQIFVLYLQLDTGILRLCLFLTSTCLAWSYTLYTLLHSCKELAEHGGFPLFLGTESEGTHYGC
jgi:hypothetical protein